MKLIRILAVIIMIVFVVGTVKDFMPGFIDGWNEAGDSKQYGNELVYVSVKPTDTAVRDSLFNSKLEEQVPYTIQEVSTRGEVPVWYKIALLSILPVGLMALYGFYCLIRVVISTTRGNVFTRKNVKRMRFFIYSVLLGGVLLELSQYFLYREWASQIVLKGYEIASYEVKYSWLPYLILALFTEIFAVGVKIKEEQDFTI